MGCIKCGGSFHPFNQIRVIPLPEAPFPSRTPSGNVPMMWPSYPRVWPPQNCIGLLDPRNNTWQCYFTKFLFPTDSIMLIVVNYFKEVSKTKAKRKT